MGHSALAIASKGFVSEDIICGGAYYCAARGSGSHFPASNFSKACSCSEPAIVFEPQRTGSVRITSVDCAILLTALEEARHGIHQRPSVDGGPCTQARG